MFGFLKGNKKEEKPSIQFSDLDHNDLEEGDTVLCLRYDMGKCIVRKTEKGYEYESLETGKRVNSALMVDAATKLQKVKKL